MRILITGAAGYLGTGIVNALEEYHDLRLFDVVDVPGPHESIVGSVADFELCQAAVDGVDAVVIAHMAPRGRGFYQNPVVPFEVNVTGTANLYTAARDNPNGPVTKVALISSIAAVLHHKKEGTFLTRDLPVHSGTHPYGLTKACQETIAQQFYLNDGIGSAVFRPAYITDEDLQKDKYGRDASEPNWQYIDRRDIGKAARLAFELGDLGYEVFYLLGHPDAQAKADLAHTRQRLGWVPDHDFTRLEAKP